VCGLKIKKKKKKKKEKGKKERGGKREFPPHLLPIGYICIDNQV
jgi:hypothetical protein